MADNIALYRPEADFTEEERIQHIADLTGIFPMSMVVTDHIQNRLDEMCIPDISDYDSDLQVCWCIPRKVVKKKSRNGKNFYVVTVIDSNSAETTIRCWSVDPEKDFIHVNRPYMIRPKYSIEWGFSTYGRVNASWILLG